MRISGLTPPPTNIPGLKGGEICSDIYFAGHLDVFLQERPSIGVGLPIDSTVGIFQNISRLGTL